MSENANDDVENEPRPHPVSRCMGIVSIHPSKPDPDTSYVKEHDFSQEDFYEKHRPGGSPHH